MRKYTDEEIAAFLELDQMDATARLIEFEVHYGLSSDQFERLVLAGELDEKLDPIE